MFILMTCAVCFAQRFTGAIIGIVTDTSGAVIPGAQVAVTDSSRGLTSKTTTNQAGQYEVTSLDVGAYTVTVQKQGFKSVVVGPIVLQVNQRAAADVVLPVGEVTQTITVSGTVAELQTQSSSLGQVINGSEMVALPMNGRDFAQLALLSAGVEPSEPGARNQLTFGFSSNGGRSFQNNFLLDGIDNNSDLADLFNNTSYAMQPSIDALQEFKVQTNDYSSEFGRGNGAVVNATIKAGTNQFHGDAYEFIRNDAVDARNFYESSRIPYAQNQFGTTLGGPINIPKLYNGRDRSFFFIDYEGLRIRQGLDYTATVPTADERAGNFQNLINYNQPAGVLDCNGFATYQGEIFNSRLTQVSPTSPTGLCGVPFAYSASMQPVNQMPANTIDPLASRLIALYPLPNAVNPAFNNFYTPRLKEDQNNFDIRVDQRFSQKDTAFSRFSFEDQPSIIPEIFPGYGGGGDFFTGTQDNSYRNFTLGETHFFGPALVNEFQFGYDRINAHRFNPNSNVNVSALLGFPGVPFQPGIGGLPSLTFSDATGLGNAAWLPTIEKQNVFNYQDGLTWIHGRHSVKFGTEIRPEEITLFQPPYSTGTLGFGVQFTDNPAAPGTGGAGLASFMLGVSSGATITTVHNVDMERFMPAFYVKDDFRVTPKLTLNLGIRWEFYSPVVEKYNQQGNFDLATQSMIVPKGVTTRFSPILSALIPLSATGTRGLVNPDYRNWAPRVGFAYSVTHHAVIRGGYGIFYGGLESGPYSGPMGQNPPFMNFQSYTTGCGAASANPALGSLDCALPGLSVLSQGFPPDALSNPNSIIIKAFDPYMPTPYMESWNLTAEYQLPSRTLLTVAYVGSAGTHLWNNFNINQAAPTANPSISYSSREPYPKFPGGITYDETSARSNYNALEITAQRQVAEGLSFLASYTWSKALCLGPGSTGVGSNNGSYFRYAAGDLNWEYGNCDFDVPQRLSFSYVYQLPFGKGKRWGSGVSRPVNTLVGEWQVNGITTFSGGNWFTITDSNANFANSNGEQRTDTIGNPNAKPCIPGTLFNTCAFADPPLGSFGNTGMNTVEGPGFSNWDFSLFKNFRFTEKKYLQFRAEFFNVFNHTNQLLVQPGPQWGIFTTVYGRPQFGFPEAAMTQREIQFALKLYY
jgi:hypothetical protein